MIMRHIIKLLAVCIVLIGTTGCKHTLESGGPYQSVAVYDFNLTIVTSWEILDMAMQWEEGNRQTLAKFPQVGQTLDAIRAKAPSAHLRALHLVEIYETSLQDGDRSAAERAVIALRSLAVEALSVMTEYGIGT